MTNVILCQARSVKRVTEASRNCSQTLQDNSHYSRGSQGERLIAVAKELLDRPREPIGVDRDIIEDSLSHKYSLFHLRFPSNSRPDRFRQTNEGPCELVSGEGAAGSSNENN